MLLKITGWMAFFLITILVCTRMASATDISGNISRTLTIMDNGRLVGNVTCTVTRAPCIVVAASGVTLDLTGCTHLLADTNLIVQTRKTGAQTSGARSPPASRNSAARSAIGLSRASCV